MKIWKKTCLILIQKCGERKKLSMKERQQERQRGGNLERKKERKKVL